MKYIWLVWLGMMLGDVTTVLAVKYSDKKCVGMLFGTVCIYGTTQKE